MRSIALLIIAAIMPLAGPALALPPDEARAWEEDLRQYLAIGEASHLDLYHTAEPGAVRDQLEALIRNLPELDREQVLVGLLHLARQFGDGHTAVSVSRPDTPRLPVTLDDFRLEYDGPFRILSTTEAHAGLLGQRIVSINGMPVDEVAERVRGATQYVENEYSLAIRTRQYLPYTELLLGLGVTDNGRSVTVVTADETGRRTRTDMEAMSLAAYDSAVRVHVNAPADPAPFERLVTASDGFWLGVDETTGTVFVNFSEYPSFQAMNGFLPEARQALAQSGVAPRYLVIDLRDNGGGDFFVGLLLSSGLLPLDSLDWGDGIYVLIGGKVFSASMSNAAQYRQILNARLIGSPTGADPVGYQETHNARLPNSGLNVTFSKRFYRFQDEPSEGIAPDVAVHSTWEDFVAGRDRVLEWVLQDIATQRADTR